MLNRKGLTLVVLILLVTAAVRFLPGCGEGLNILTEGDPYVTPVEPLLPPPPPPPIDPWADFNYRRGITITNSGTAQTDYQVNIILNNTNFSFNNADLNGSDIRFRSGDVSISYWIENWDGSGETASIWIKVPSIAAGDTVLYLYYGDNTKTSESNFDNTFTKDSGFSGLAAHWHMDEGSGSTVGDSSGNSNDGTIANALWVNADGGKWFTNTSAGFSSGDSLVLDGVGDYVTISDNALIDVVNVTILLWFKADSVASTQYLVAKWLPTGNNRAYSFFLNGSSVVFETSIDGSSYNTLTSTTTVSSGVWYHFAATYNGTTKVIYINGISDNNNSTSGNLKDSSANLTLGTVNDVTLADFYKGVIDEVSIYNTALTADQIKALSQRRKDSPGVGDIPVVGAEEVVP